MELFKRCLRVCCKRCVDERKDSDASTKIILPPPSRRGSTYPSVTVPQTFTCLAQPDFEIPNSTQYSNLTLPVSARRKHSSPSVLTTAVAIQLTGSTSNLMESTISMPDPAVYIHDVDENWNRTKSDDTLWRCDSTPMVNIHTSPSSPPSGSKSTAVKRLSLAAIHATHSRRSSMSSFDISKDEVDSDLYDSSELLPDSESNGRLCFSIHYDPDFDQMNVHVICAKGLRHHDNLSPVHDSYVKVSLMPPCKKKPNKTHTATQRGTEDPLYNETFTFDAISVTKTEYINLKLTVCTFDKSSKRRKLGTIVHKFDADSLQKHSDVKIWRHLTTEGIKVTEERGNLLLAMSHQLRESQLKVCVVKATDLDIEDHEKPIEGVYVKVVLIGNGKVVQKKKTRIIHQAMKQPVFDETFTFSLPAGLANQSCLIVSVCGKTANNKRQHIGYVSLGPPFFATGSGLEQWTKMLSSPFTTVGKWHSLSVWSKNDSSQHLVNECNVF